MAEIPNVRLSLPNRPENVLIVRQALTGVAECLGLDAIDTNDINTAVTEACNNVVMHAYADREGPLEVELYTLADAITVVVRDHGEGMPEEDEVDGTDAAGGMGIPVIETLCQRVRFIDVPDGGTEVRMEFALPKAASLEPLEGEEHESVPLAWGEPVSMFDLRLAPTAIARAVLPRVLSALAARAYFSTDRISDVQLVADVLAANSGDSIAGTHLDVGVTVAPRNLVLRIGPLLTGHGESIVSAAADGSAPIIERLTDAKRIAAARTESAETLELRLADRR